MAIFDNYRESGRDQSTIQAMLPFIQIEIEQKLLLEMCFIMDKYNESKQFGITSFLSKARPSD